MKGAVRCCTSLNFLLMADGCVIFCYRLAGAVQRMGIESFFSVQVATWLETIGPGAFQRDICINSPTGSGKTLAYALPIAQMLSSKSMVLCLS